ncbi:F-box protein PP2-B11 [Ananas comosus]|uniref:F-box protein PP2-B11 n=1 Tax=Ananas comosus TaxID=4615 RepID=A0A199URC9_ANACO|nr:F-box protein PP2-B11 [Ananas comosus]
MEGSVAMSALPEGCIAQAISLTTPRDACRSAAVSAVFRSAAASDCVWKRFLPSDLPSILSRAVDPVECPSKRDLYFRLCDRPILLDAGAMSFRLDRSSGAKCFMLSAKALSIIWGVTPQYWTWAPHPNSRFPQVAKLLNVCWLEIRGKIKSKLLSPNTTYAAYLIFKVDENYNGLSYPPQEAMVILGSQVSERTLRLVRPRMGAPARRNTRIFRSFLNWRGVLAVPQSQDEAEEEEEEEDTSGVEVSPRSRDDGWMEVELGEFYNAEGEDGEVEMSLMEVRGGHWKRGLIVEGIEIKPKYA